MLKTHFKASTKEILLNLHCSDFKPTIGHTKTIIKICEMVLKHKMK